MKNLCHDGVGDGTLVRRLEPRHPFRQNTKHVDVQVLSDVINIYIQNKIHQNKIHQNMSLCPSSQFLSDYHVQRCSRFILQGKLIAHSPFILSF